MSLAQLTEVLQAGVLAVPPAELLIDCAGLVIPHPLGVSHFVTQLLQLRRRGACIWLTNVNPVLRRCLHQLGLGGVFHLNG